MKLLWTWRLVDATIDVVWDVLTDTEAWPVWGPSVRAAEVRSGASRPGVIGPGATGSVTIPTGTSVGFEITWFEDRVGWAWRVAGIPATSHRVEARGPDTTRVGFGVPWVAAPYLAVCRLALERIAEHTEGARR